MRFQKNVFDGFTWNSFAQDFFAKLSRILRVEKNKHKSYYHLVQPRQNRHKIYYQHKYVSVQRKYISIRFQPSKRNMNYFSNTL